MPPIYRHACTHCRYHCAIMDHLEFFDANDFRALRHPNEYSELEDMGYTPATAMNEGRLFQFSYCVCEDCRSIVGRRERLQLGASEADDDGHPASFNKSIILGVAAVLMPWTLLRRCLAHGGGRLRKNRDVRDATTGRCRQCRGTRLAYYAGYVHDYPDALMRCPRCNEVRIKHDRDYTAVA